jgi:hypothetical protein
VAERYDKVVGAFDEARDLSGEEEEEDDDDDVDGEVYRDDKGIALRALDGEGDGIAGSLRRTFAVCGGCVSLLFRSGVTDRLFTKVDFDPETRFPEET